MPAAAGASLGLALAAGAVYLVLRRCETGLTPDEPDPGARLAVLLVLSVAVGLAVLSTFMNRPDADDITFFPRAAAQASHLWSPILTTDTTSDVAGLPGPSTGYLLTSWEFLLALGARLIGVDALSTYQNGGAALGSAVVPALYYLLFRRLGLRPLLAAAAVGGVVAFLLLDGNDHRSMGNLAFVRLWQGKSILLTLLPAYLLLHSLDYIWRGRGRAWLCVAFSGVAATGLSTVGCFFAPAAIAVTTAAVCSGLLLARKMEWRLLVARGLRLLLTASYPLAAIVLTLASPVSSTFSPLAWIRAANNDSTGRMSVSSDLRSLGWLAQILLPPSSLFRMAWALILVAATPLLTLKRPRSYVVSLFAPLFLLFVANPLAGGLLYGAVTDVYWRFFYLLPVPLCSGLLVALLVRAVAAVRRGDGGVVMPAAGAALGVALVAAFVLTVSVTTLSKDNVGFGFKSPTAWKLDAATLKSIGPSLAALKGKRVLADETASVALALVDPSIRVVAQRPANTLVEFTLGGRPAEGRARVTAQNVVAGADASAQDLRTLGHVLSQDADAVVVRTTADGVLQALLAATRAPWRRIGGDSLYTVYVRQRSRP